ncbi:glutamate-5-semialdehyde dehydrogenase [Globicatella sp. PHS-GS-PNBC-21-1553]|uniref:glutamate-5-semialdehyde dehydrogenase n=1 Tax=Globicatella sp. PHS-GS-PNBC-21-1553 TaxID=2885764 RepID=UPI00298ED1C2|nr:glutamate-5-semialdehyde dehydrogenase [Globicatella sp. PHS-GS-PNBC-21-1553]WPC08044.1 glutamate-5-semialdehyde dehydrogenase [Globicatella sp. PHS-GS-PNBC-21-1553]
MKTTQTILQTAKEVKASINFATTVQKNEVLTAMAAELLKAIPTILAANAADLAQAKGQIADIMLDRLMLNEARIEDMATGILAVKALNDPIGRVLEERTLENGLELTKRSVPFGVLGMIYESRPNVTADVAALAVKSGNAVVLRGGKEAYRSSKAICDALRQGIKQAGLNPDIVQLIEDTTRASSKEMMKTKGYIDLLIPRGGAGLIQTVMQEATVPVIETGTGICHIYVDQTTNITQAIKVVNNAKTSRPSVCNSAEVLLVHQAIAKELLTQLATTFQDRVELRADERALNYLPQATLAKDDDFATEFLDYIMAIKVVDSVDEAIEHINQHSTGHSESILSDDPIAIMKFTEQVDSSSIYVNASTRFTDGGEFGLGCEIGISTQKMHARGPMGLRELTSYKYILKGNHTIR